LFGSTLKVAIQLVTCAAAFSCSSDKAPTYASSTMPLGSLKAAISQRSLAGACLRFSRVLLLAVGFEGDLIVERELNGETIHDRELLHYSSPMTTGSIVKRKRRTKGAKATWGREYFRTSALLRASFKIEPPKPHGLHAATEAL
jgi:hypothetical protein